MWKSDSGCREHLYCQRRNLSQTYHQKLHRRRRGKVQMWSWRSQNRGRAECRRYRNKSMNGCIQANNKDNHFEKRRKICVFLCSSDPPRIDADDLAAFVKPVVIKTGKEAAFKVSFVGREPMKIQWYNDGEELLEDTHIKIERSSTHSRLLLTKCQRRISGEIKVKVKNECGTAEAITQMVVLGLWPSFLWLHVMMCPSRGFQNNCCYINVQIGKINKNILFLFVFTVNNYYLQLHARKPSNCSHLNWKYQMF